MRYTSTRAIPLGLCFFFTIASAIPGEQNKEALSPSKDTLVREKRGWGYETVVNTVPVATQNVYTVPAYSETVLTAPVVTAPIVTAPVAPRTQIISAPVAPRTQIISAPAAVPVVHHAHTESLVWQRSPNYVYYLHQMHPQYAYQPVQYGW